MIEEKGVNGRISLKVSFRLDLMQSASIAGSVLAPLASLSIYSTLCSLIQHILKTIARDQS